MRPSLLRYLVCPACQAPLALETTKAHLDVIVEGHLDCHPCGRRFPIVRGIPRVLAGPLERGEERTSEAFGWLWREFAVLHGQEDYRRQFMDWIHPVQPEFFRDKVVLDAGCGMGRFASVASELGARDVIAFDLSEAVEAAQANLAAFANVHVIQADLYRLPLCRDTAAPIDFAFSIGVLHHLPSPEDGFSTMVRHVKPGGAVLAWVYGRENNEWIVRWVNPIRERITSQLPPRLLRAGSFCVALALHGLLKVLYRPAHRWRDRLPYSAYLAWLSQFRFRHTHAVIFDHLSAPTTCYIRREEFQGWFDRAGLTDRVITWRNQNSWRGLGFRPEPLPRA
ncbi:MAG: methyltransferase domain-containing protein [Acidobacteriota bacterium]